MKKRVEPSAMQKLSDEFAGVTGREETTFDKPPKIRVIVDVDGEKDVYDLDTLFIVGVKAGTVTEDSACYTNFLCGNLSKPCTDALIKNIEMLIRNHPPLRRAKGRVAIETLTELLRLEDED